MFKHQLRQLLYESNSPWLLLKPVENLTSEQLLTLFKTKPGEINIILSRTVQLIKNDHPGKTTREVILDVLDVLSRSFIARQFVGLGVEKEYKLFKGFAVRKGDYFENMPSIGDETILKPKANFISWTTGNPEAREDAVSYDKNKGKPLGGMLVKTHVAGSNIIWDINAVIKAARQYFNDIEKYNQSAAPGMAISKTNIEFLAKKAQDYNGKFEIITTVESKTVIVEDKWSFEGDEIVWVGNKTTNTSSEPNEDAEPPVTEKLSEDDHFDFQLDEGLFDLISRMFKGTGDAGKEWAKALKNKYNILKQLSHDEEMTEKINKLYESITALLPEDK